MLVGATCVVRRIPKVPQKKILETMVPVFGAAGVEDQWPGGAKPKAVWFVVRRNTDYIARDGWLQCLGNHSHTRSSRAEGARSPKLEPRAKSQSFGNLRLPSSGYPRFIDV